MFSHELNHGQPKPTPPGNNGNHPEHLGKPPHPDHPPNPPHPEHPDHPVKPETPITILVNGQYKQLPVGAKQISYEEVVALAYPGQGDNGVNIIYTVSYSNGPEKNPKGNLAKGKSVFVQEGMIFNVSRSDKS